MAGWYGWKLLRLAALPVIAGAGATLGAQNSTGALAGRLTDLNSCPIGGATVLLRNRETGAALEATTNRNGVYRFEAVPAGEYSLEAESASQGHGHLDGIVVAAGHEAHVQAAMQLEAEKAAAQTQPVASDQLETARWSRAAFMRRTTRNCASDGASLMSMATMPRSCVAWM